MSEIPGDLKFLKTHEWARVEDSGRITVGISDHAQGLLGDLVYVELPNVGDEVEQGAACAVVESVKAASDVYAPVSGKVVEVNAALADKPRNIARSSSRAARTFDSCNRSIAAARSGARGAFSR